MTANPASPCLPPDRLRWLLLLLLGVIALAVFGASLRCELLFWDDDVNIFDNPHIRSLDGPALRWMFTDVEYARRYLPLAWLGWALQYQCFGLHPLTYHLGNVLFHVLNSLLVFLLIDRLLSWNASSSRPAPPAGEQAGMRRHGTWGAFLFHVTRMRTLIWGCRLRSWGGTFSPSRGEGRDEGGAGWETGTSRLSGLQKECATRPDLKVATAGCGSSETGLSDSTRPARLICAFLGALLWVVHPLRVEAVAWASARIYLQATCFLLVALLAYLEYVSRARTPKGAAGWFWLSVAAYTVSLLTYPIALMALVVLVIMDVYPLRRLELGRFGVAGLKNAAWWKEKLPYLVVSILVFAATMLARLNSGIYLKPVSLAEFGVVDRVMQSCYVWMYYVWRPWWPFDLSPVYPALISFRPWAWPFLGSLVALLALSILAVVKRRAYPAVLAIWLAHLVLLVPFLGLTEHPHFASDRYSYLAGILGSVVLAMGLLRVSRGGLARPLAYGAVLSLAGAFSVLSVQQIAHWRDSVGLHRHMIGTLGEHPYRAKLLLALGVLYQKSSQADPARACFEEVLRIQPDQTDARCNLADLLTDRREFKAAREQYEEVLRVVPGHQNARQNFGICLAIQGDLEGAADQFLQLLQAHPENARAHHNLSLTLAQLGRTSEAEHHREKAEQLRISQSRRH